MPKTYAVAVHFKMHKDLKRYYFFRFVSVIIGIHHAISRCTSFKVFGSPRNLHKINLVRPLFYVKTFNPSFAHMRLLRFIPRASDDGTMV